MNIPPQPESSSEPLDNDADRQQEALDQLEAIHSQEEDRRKTADSKLSSTQNAIGFTITLASSSVALTYLQSPTYDFLHILIVLSLAFAIGFFVFASYKIMKGNDPKPYQRRMATGVRSMLKAGKSKKEMQLDAINDLVSNINANIDVTNERMTFYRAAIENITKGVIAAGAVPLIISIDYIVNVIKNHHILSLLHGIQTNPSLPQTPSMSSFLNPNFLQSEPLLNIIGMLLPFAGIALSCWSFRWSEDGSTPDVYSGQETWNPEEEILHMGERFRARQCAKTTFNAGALLLAAAVPAGSATNHIHDPINLYVLGTITFFLFTICYCVFQVFQIWKSRREDAFSIYYNKDMFFLYDSEKTKKIYFRLNPMPIWSIVDREWFSKRKLPEIDEIYKKASKAPIS